ncbi:hypothetical protein F0562_000989 [Nyssa sinensis]|uniref:Uncharacterized protein n=1 Tax=Nyssa sinensis TaxID=561372 RepID=A0A5J5C1P5_9ASTE|nr:hypothetical protein F0562_000989 [Nyssa sinensis]
MVQFFLGAARFSHLYSREYQLGASTITVLVSFVLVLPALLCPSLKDSLLDLLTSSTFQIVKVGSYPEEASVFCYFCGKEIELSDRLLLRRHYAWKQLSKFAVEVGRYLACKIDSKVLEVVALLAAVEVVAEAPRPGCELDEAVLSMEAAAEVVYVRFF